MPTFLPQLIPWWYLWGGEWDEGYDYGCIILSHPFQMAGRDAKQRREMYKKKQREKFCNTLLTEGDI